MRSVAPLRRLALLAFVWLFAVAPSGGLGCSGEPARPLSEAASALRLRFPDQAAAVLERDEDFVEAGERFVVRAPAQAGTWRRLQVELPRDGGGVIRFRTAGGFEARVRALGMEGEGALAEQAVVYRRTGGISFWSAVPGGVEEWLLLDAGVARGAVAAWEIDGASTRQRGDAVEVVDDRGAARLRVTAPIAYASGGREVKTRLEAQGTRIALSVDGGGDAVLVDPEWVSVDSMSVARYAHTATVLEDGRVLVAGGYDEGVALASAEVYDPVTGAWTATLGGMSAPRAGHTATPLGNGTVLVAGGYNGAYLDTAEIYTEATNTWVLVGDFMNSARGYHTATLLVDGKVLVAGGASNGVVLNSSELYDPGDQSWTQTVNAMSTPRNVHTATLLADGRVLVAGGADDMGAVVSSAVVFDPSDESWTSVDMMGFPREYHTATLLDSGDVLVVGGDDGASVLASAELYDGAGWTPAVMMDGPRGAHTATLLGNGDVLVTGGIDGAFVPLASAALYTPPPVDAWTPVQSAMSTARNLHTAALLASGEVLVVGGLDDTGASLASAELYTLPVGDPCAAADDCQTGSCVDGVCCDAPCDGDCSACSAAAKGSGVDGECGLAAVGNACGDAATCTGTVVSGAGACNAEGTCELVPMQDCSPFACVDGACLTTCATEAECATPNDCQQVSCDMESQTCALFQKLDNTPCPGGVCIAGGCFLGSSANSTGSGGAGGGGGGGGGAGMSGSGATTTGAGATTGANGDGSEGDPRFHGGACGVARGAESPASSTAPRGLWIVVGLLVAWRSRRRARRSCDAPPGPPELEYHRRSTS